MRARERSGWLDNKTSLKEKKKNNIVKQFHCRETGEQTERRDWEIVFSCFSIFVLSFSISVNVLVLFYACLCVSFLFLSFFLSFFLCFFHSFFSFHLCSEADWLLKANKTNKKRIDKLKDIQTLWERGGKHE